MATPARKVVKAATSRRPSRASRTTATQAYYMKDLGAPHPAVKTGLGHPEVHRDLGQPGLPSPGHRDDVAAELLGECLGAWRPSFR